MSYLWLWCLLFLTTLPRRGSGSASGSGTECFLGELQELTSEVVAFSAHGLYVIPHSVQYCGRLVYIEAYGNISAQVPEGISLLQVLTYQKLCDGTFRVTSNSTIDTNHLDTVTGYANLNLSVTVQGGDLIGIRIPSECKQQEKCFFQPTIMSNNSMEVWYNENNDINMLQSRTGVLLNVRASIVPHDLLSCQVQASDTLPSVGLTAVPIEHEISLGELRDLGLYAEGSDIFGLYVVEPSVRENGTLVSIESRGFFIRPMEQQELPVGQQYLLHVLVYRETCYNGTYEELYRISVSSTNDDNEAYGYIKVDVNVRLQRGDLIAVEMPNNCSGQFCPFQPAIVSNVTIPVMYNQEGNINMVQPLANISLNVQVNIAVPVHVGVQLCHMSSSVLQSTAVIESSMNASSFLNQTPVKTMSPSEHQQSAPVGSGVIAAIAIFSCCFLLICSILIVWAAFVCCKSRRKHSLAQTQEQENRVVHCNNLTPTSTTVGHNGSRSASLHLQAKRSNEFATSFQYDYVQETRLENATLNGKHHSEYDPDKEDPYWEPSRKEDELKNQLQIIGIEEITTENIRVYEELGSGQFGVVNRGVWCVEDKEKEVAVKSLADGSSRMECIHFLQEAVIMGQFKHPNVIRLYGILTDNDPMLFVVEIMHIGDLRSHLLSIRPKKGIFPLHVLPPETPAVLLSFCRQIASGMNYLASKNFVHRDLAARNILVSEGNVCKIADFGMARNLLDSEYYISHGGRILVKWTAPEALDYKKYSTASDVWSFGIVMYEIWAVGIKPYQGITNAEVHQKVQTGYRLPPPSGCPKSVYQIMMKCWNPLHGSRPTFPDILLELQHPDFKLLMWTPEDVAAYSEQARTLGAPLEAGEELYTHIQQTFC